MAHQYLRYRRRFADRASIVVALWRRWEWETSPATLHPDEEVWSEPTRVIKSARFEGNRLRYRLQNLIDADSALGTEHARMATVVADLILSGTRSFAEGRKRIKRYL